MRDAAEWQREGHLAVYFGHEVTFWISARKRARYSTQRTLDDGRIRVAWQQSINRKHDRFGAALKQVAFDYSHSDHRLKCSRPIVFLYRFSPNRRAARLAKERRGSARRS